MQQNTIPISLQCCVVLCCDNQSPIIPSIFLFDSVELRRPKSHRIKPINVWNMSSEVLDALSYPLKLLKRKDRETDEVETYIPVINGSVLTSHMDAARLSTLLGDRKVPLEKEHSSKYLLFLFLRNVNQEIFLPPLFEILNFILVCCHQNVPYRTVQFQIVNHFIDISNSLVMMSYRRKLFLFF